MAVVDTIYGEFKDAALVLERADEVSLKIMLESNLRKTILLSSASYFEYTLSREVEKFVEEATSGNSLVISIVANKAISRQYHTWFDWDKSNANKFFSLFGKEFKEHMEKLVGQDQTLVDSIRAFLELGQLRNLLVHSDYASYQINKTAEEIYDLYKNAQRFVSSVGSELRRCSKDVSDLKNQRN